MSRGPGAGRANTKMAPREADPATPGLGCRLGIVAELAAESVRLLHQARTGHDVYHLVEIFLALHVLVHLALDDDDGADTLMLFLAIVPRPHQRRDGFFLLIGLDDVGRIEAAGVLHHARPVREADVGIGRAPL